MSEWESEPLISETEDQDQAESLLLSAQSQSRFLFAFNHADIAALAQHLSILSFDAGELIMQRGQLATWVGILLSGELSAIIGNSVVGTTRPGALVGEVSFFKGGRRMADVQGSLRGHLALIMMPNLISLLESCPSAGVKLLRAFGTSSLYQLTRNPTAHPPISWNMGAADREAAAERWNREFFQSEAAEMEITPADVDLLLARVKCRSFSEGVVVIDRFAQNECVCFLIAGTVDLKLSGATLGKRTAGDLLLEL